MLTLMPKTPIFVSVLAVNQLLDRAVRVGMLLEPTAEYLKVQVTSTLSCRCTACLHDELAREDEDDESELPF